MKDRKEEYRRYYVAHKEKILKNVRKWNQENPERYKDNYERNNDKRRKAPRLPIEVYASQAKLNISSYE